MANYYGDKTEHAFKAFAQDLRGSMDYPVIFMYGAEDYLIEWAVGQLVKRFVGRGAGELDFEKPEADAAVEDIINACETFSMFSEKRVVWVKDLPALSQDNAKGWGEKQLHKLEEYLDAPNPGTILIFSSSKVKNDPRDRREKKSKLNKLLLQKAKCYDFCPLDRKALRAFIEKRIRSAGLTIGRDDLEYLVDSTGYFHKDTEYRLMNLNSDLEKIVSLALGAPGGGQGPAAGSAGPAGAAGQGRPTAPGTGTNAEVPAPAPYTAHQPVGKVSREDIDRAILGDMDTYVFDFLDYVSSNRKEEAFLLLNNMFSAGSDVFGILSILVNQFELMTEIRELSEEGMGLPAITKEMGMHEFRIKKALAAANRMSLGKLKTTLRQLYDIDTDIKQGNIDGALALELLIGRI